MGSCLFLANLSSSMDTQLRSLAFLIHHSCPLHSSLFNAVHKKYDSIRSDIFINTPCQNTHFFRACISPDSEPAPSTPMHEMNPARKRKHQEFSLKRKGTERPPLNYTSNFEPPSEVTLTVIGYVRSPYKERFGTPRQAPVTHQTLGGKKLSAVIELNENANFELALRGLEHFDYCWVLSWMHLNHGWNPLVKPPRGPREKQGLFATRAPHRPNPIALSALKIEKVDHKNRRIYVHGIDLLDSTPVLDIKPYVTYCDSFQNAACGLYSGFFFYCQFILYMVHNLLHRPITVRKPQLASLLFLFSFMFTFNNPEKNKQSFLENLTIELPVFLYFRMARSTRQPVGSRLFILFASPKASRKLRR